VSPGRDHFSKLRANGAVQANPLPGQEAGPWGGLVDGLVDLGLLREAEGPALGLHRVLRFRLRERVADAVREAVLDRAVGLGEKRGAAVREGWVAHEARWEVDPLVALRQDLEAEGRRVASASFTACQPGWKWLAGRGLSRWRDAGEGIGVPGSRTVAGTFCSTDRGATFGGGVAGGW